MTKRSTPLLWCTAGFLMTGMGASAATPHDTDDASREIDDLNVVWNSPSRNAKGSMPIGNGDIGLNVWVEPNGDLLLYVGKTDAWSENGRLLKLGRVRVRLSPNPFAESEPFRQELHLRDGEITIQGGSGKHAASVRVWVDAHHPAAHIEVESQSEVTLQAVLERWRTRRRQLPENEMHSAYGLMNGPEPVFVEPDHVVHDLTDRVVWFHRNERSIWKRGLELQALDALAEASTDPLLHLTFGAALLGKGLVACGPTRLESKQPAKSTRLSLCALTAQTETAKEWENLLAAEFEKMAAFGFEDLRARHRGWWRDFWRRSYILVSGPEEARELTLGTTLHRYMTACAGRGNAPIKFNGSIFNVSGTEPGKRGAPKEFDADYRSWGQPYWFQNTRQIYWPMLAQGDYDLMQPLFRMYLEALDLARARTRVYYDHEGAFFPETMYFWGACAESNYGWDREGKPDGLTDNLYIRYYWQGGLELLSMMLDYFSHTGDRDFARTTLLPFGREIVLFFEQHWPRDEKGKIRFEPAQALESLRDVVNPVPEIAGLTRTLRGLLALPEDLTTDEERALWRKTLDDLPPLPFTEQEGQRILDVAEEVRGAKQNVENVALYAVFPYRLFGVGKPELETLRRTYMKRENTGYYRCWHNDNVFAAWLGLASEARIQLAKRSVLSGDYRFPAMYSFGDWAPDGDNGGVAQQALQAMLMQADGDRIILLPAWPKEWDVRFRLHAPRQTIVEGEYHAGKLDVRVKPAERAADLVRMDPQ